MTQAQEKPQQITSTLNFKFIAAYFKRQHKDRPIRVQRCEEAANAFYMTDGFLSIKVPFHPDLYPYTFGWSAWERATFPKGEVIPKEGGEDQAAYWRSSHRSLDLNNHALTLTPFLLEQPGATHKPGKLSRKLFFMGTDDAPDEVIHTDVYIDKYAMDMLNPDLDALKGFLFETSGHECPVRVSAVNGVVGYLMPKCNIENYLKVN